MSANQWIASASAAQNSGKMREMTDLMFGEFAKYQVLPLDASFTTRFATPRPSLSAGRKVFTYSGAPMTGIPDNAGPNLLNTSYTITADIDVPQGGAEGAILSDGGRFGGYGLYLLHGKPVFTWNLLGLRMVKWQGPDALAPGKHQIVYDFKYDGIGFATLAFNSTSGLGRSGTGTLMIDGKAVSTQKMEHTIPLGLSLEAMFDIGSKTNTPIDPQDYQTPFAFTGKIDKITISVAPPVLTEADKQKLEAAYRTAQDAN
jgi:arylsulfatase